MDLGLLSSAVLASIVFRRSPKPASSRLSHRTTTSCGCKRKSP